MADEITCNDLIKALMAFPPDKPVKVLAGGSNYEEDYPDVEEIHSIGYPLENVDDEIDEAGNPVFSENDECVIIFTKEYADMILMNGV